MTYNEAYNKIIDAYFKDEIQPLNSDFCFCGSLCETSHWKGGNELYSAIEYDEMEAALLDSLLGLPTYSVNYAYKFVQTEHYERSLFEGMSNALDVLKSIHEKRGEIIDEPINFKKRKLNTSTTQMS